MQNQFKSTDQCHVSDDEVASTLRGVRWSRIYLGAVLVVLVLLAFMTLLRAWSDKSKERSAIQQIENMGGKIVFRRVYLQYTRIVVRRGDPVAARFYNFDFSGKDLSCLQDLDKLSTLHLGGSQNLDEFLRYAKLAPSLHQIWMGSTDVTAAGLAELRGKQSLFGIILGSNRGLDSAMFSELLNIPNLRYLGLIGADFQPEELEVLVQHPQLIYLDLQRTNLSDSDIDRLASFTDLKSLNLTKTKLTEEGVAELQRRLPQTKIRWKSL